MDNHETKAPPTGYQQFIADHKDEIREIWKKNVEESVQEGQRKITFIEALSAEWTRLPASVKAQYKAEAKDRMQKYRDDNPYAW